MSELKAMTVLNVLQMGCYDNALVYFKSEADKVIAEKDAELRRHKYRRCLAMAKLAVTDDYLPWNMKWHNRWLELAEKFKEAK